MPAAKFLLPLALLSLAPIASAQIAATSLTSAYVGEPISTGAASPYATNTTSLITVTGGSGNYFYTLTSGNLPPGLSLIPQSQQPTSGSGAISGTITGAGTFTYTLQVTDTSTPAFTATVTGTTVVTINPLTIVPATLPGGIVGTVYGGTGQFAGFLPAALGGIAPYHWSLVSGSLPAGLLLQPTTSYPTDTSTQAGALTGSPTSPGTFSFTLQVTDSSPTPQTAIQTFSMSVTGVQSFTPANSPQPFGIAAGPDGALWYTQQTATGPADPQGAATYGIASVTTAGTFQPAYYLSDVNISGLPTPPTPYLITTGPDHNLWFTESTQFNGGSGQPYLGQISTSGAVNQFAIAPPGVDLTSVYPFAGGIAGDPSGAVWFTVPVLPFSSTHYAGIARISTASNHTISYFPITSNPISAPQGIVMGPDGALWFADVVQDQNGNTIGAIGRMTAAGVLAPPPGCNSPTLECPIAGTVGPQFLAAGPDGAIWFTDASNQIGRITADGKTITMYQVPTSNANPSQIVAGPDGALWFTETGSGVSQIGRVTTAGVITEFPLQVAALGITSGPDGALWITDNSGNIDRIVPSIALACSLSSSLQVGAPLPANSGCPSFGGTPPYSYAVTSGSLPAGLTLNASSGTLSGVPDAPGTFAFTITGTDSTRQTASQVFNVTVAPRPPLVLSCTFPPGAQVTLPYTANCTTSGGIPPYAYSISAGTLPAGLTLTPTASGVTISGVPAVYGTFSFTVQAADSGVPQFTATQQASAFSVLPPPLRMACNFSAKAEVNVPYVSNCTAIGGVPPYNFSFASSSTPPAGLTIASSTGQVSGTPTTAGTSSFAVTVHDSGPPVQTVTTPATVTVIPPKLGLMCDFTKIGTVGTPYNTTCAVANGVAPYTFRLASGSLPAGLTLNSATGAVSGTPSASGSFAFRIQLGDSDTPPQSAIQNVTLTILPLTLKITATSLPDGATGLPYSGDPAAAGGTKPYTWSVAGGTLPAGLNLDPQTGAITGTPATSGSYSFTLQVSDTSTPKQTATQAYNGTISASVAPDFAEYPLPVSSGVTGITSGPDGALWFTTLDQAGGNVIGRITTAGAITTFPAPNPLSATAVPGGITTGPDGTLWFTEADSDRIGQISTDGTFSIDYPVTSTAAAPQQISAGPDGALWFSESAAAQIGRISSTGAMLNEFATPTPASAPGAMVIGPDNAIWFIETSVNNIGRITTDGATKNEYPIPTPGSHPTSIAVGPDGALWFTEQAASKIGRISLTGHITEYTTPTPVSGPAAITPGADGALYFTESSANQIGRITTSGVISEYAVPTTAGGLQGITLGSDGAIWFAENSASKVARFAFVTQLAMTCTFPPSTPPVPLGSTYSASCTAAQGLPPYTYSVSKGSLPPGVSLNAQTGVLSGTLTTPGTFTFTIQAADSSDPQQAATQTAPPFTVLPGALSISCSLPAGQTGAPYSGSCTPSGGTAPYAWSISAGALPNGLNIDPSSGAITGTPAAPGTFTFTVLASDSSSPMQTAAQNETVTIQLGSGPGGSVFTFAGLPATQPPAVNLTNVQLQLAQSYPAPISGSVSLSFQYLANDGSGQLPNGYMDPALQFVDSSGNKLGTTYNFTIPAGSTSITLPAIDPGTVAGTIVLTVTSGTAQSQGTVVIEGAAPSIEPGSVQFTNVSSTGFDVELVVTDVLLNGTQANFVFSPASGAALEGISTFPVDISTALTNWYSTAAGQSNGGVFSLRVHFPFSGSLSAIGSVSVTVGNSIGTSQPVTGKPQ